MKTMRKWLAGLGALGLAACAGPSYMAGDGQATDQTGYSYTVQNLGLPYRLDNVAVVVSVIRDNEGSPVEPQPGYVADCFRQELNAHAARTAVAPGADPADLKLDLSLSRYVTQQYGDYYMTFIDGGYIIENVPERLNYQGTVSLAGRGPTQAAASSQAVNSLVAKILQDRRTADLVSRLASGSANKSTVALDRLALNLKTSFSAKLAAAPSRRIAIAEFKGEGAENLANVFAASVLKNWGGAGCQFFTRAQLDVLMREYSLQMQGVLSGEDILSLGKLKIVDFIITRSVSRAGGGQIIECQVIDTRDGQILAAAREVIN
jgi:TolB-like protein